MSRTPKLGEVWTAADGRAFTCIDAEPDDAGDYGWAYFLAGKALKAYEGIYGMTPPKADPPERLKAAPWLAMTRTSCALTPDTTAESAWNRHSTYIGALNVLTGEWVDRD